MTCKPSTDYPGEEGYAEVLVSEEVFFIRNSGPAESTFAITSSNASPSATPSAENLPSATPSTASTVAASGVGALALFMAGCHSVAKAVQLKPIKRRGRISYGMMYGSQAE